MNEKFDVVVVGARCAGSALACLLARGGLRVLLIDRMEFPSDILSTHTIQLAGMDALSRWGLLAEFKDHGLRPFSRMALDFDGFRIEGRPRAAQVDFMFCCRRFVLDAFLQSQAARAGAVVRTKLTLDELCWSGDTVTGCIVAEAKGTRERIAARTVVGADGMRSTVARLVSAREYGFVSSKTFTFYGYWRGLPIAQGEIFVREGAVLAMVPTNQDETIVVVQRRIEEFDAFRGAIDTNFRAAWRTAAPDYYELLMEAEQTERLRGAPHQHTFFRQPMGPGWALVGDAGCHKDSVTAQGITNAFRDAEMLSEILIQQHHGPDLTAVAMANHAKRRDAYLAPIVDRALDLAELRYPDAVTGAALRRIAEDPAAVSEHLGIDAGTVPIPRQRSVAATQTESLGVS